MIACWLKTSSPEHSGPATVTGPRRPGRPARDRSDPVLLPDQDRPQHVVDAAVEDDDRRALDGLAVDDARQVGARRPDEEPAGLEQEPGVGQERVRRPVRDDRRDPRSQPDQVERFLVGLVRDAETAARIDEPDGRARQPGELDGRPRRRRHVLDERGRVEDVGGPEGVQPEQLEVRGAGRVAGRGDEVARVHPELARAVVADEADAFEPGVLGHGRAEQDRDAPSRLRGDRAPAAPARRAIRP